MPRSPVTFVINAFSALTEDEKKLCLDFIAPEPEPEPPVKQTRKKRTTKSAKAQSLESVIAKVPKADAQINTGWCTAMIPGLGVACGDPADNKVHDPSAGYAGYHPFESSAPVVEKKSRRKAAAANSTLSTETNSEGALAVGAGD